VSSWSLARICNEIHGQQNIKSDHSLNDLVALYIKTVLLWPVSQLRYSQSSDIICDNLWTRK